MTFFQVDIDFEKDPIGTDKDGKSVYFKDIWPTTEEIAEVGDLTFACDVSELHYLIFDHLNEINYSVAL